MTTFNIKQLIHQKMRNLSYQKEVPERRKPLFNKQTMKVRQRLEEPTHFNYNLKKKNRNLPKADS